MSSTNNSVTSVEGSRPASPAASSRISTAPARRRSCRSGRRAYRAPRPRDTRPGCAAFRHDRRVKRAQWRAGLATWNIRRKIDTRAPRGFSSLRIARRACVGMASAHIEAAGRRCNGFAGRSVPRVVARGPARRGDCTDVRFTPVIRLPGVAAMLLAGGALVLTGGCSRIRDHKGYVVDSTLIDTVQPGVDNRDFGRQDAWPAELCRRVRPAIAPGIMSRATPANWPSRGPSRWRRRS